MKRNSFSRLAIVAVACVASLTACGVDNDDDREDRAHCSTVYVPMFFSTVDQHYHYSSPKGRVVPAHKVPVSARKVSGYKPPVAPKIPTGSKPNMQKPAPAPKPAPRVGGFR